VSYEIYTTEAIVCGRILRGEHDLTLRLYTKDAGMIFARAGGARAGESKLRYGLQDFSYSTVSLVHGRHEWRVTGASPIENFYYATPTREHRAALRHALRIIRRFLAGASAEPALFESVREGMRSLLRRSLRFGRCISSATSRLKQPICHSWKQPRLRMRDSPMRSSPGHRMRCRVL